MLLVLFGLLLVAVEVATEAYGPTVIVKLGGSAVTVKDVFETLKEEVISQVTAQLDQIQQRASVREKVMIQENGVRHI